MRALRGHARVHEHGSGPGVNRMSPPLGVVKRTGLEAQLRGCASHVIEQRGTRHKAPGEAWRNVRRGSRGRGRRDHGLARGERRRRARAARRRARRGRRAGVCACQIPASRRTRRESAAVARPTPRRAAKAAAMPSRPAHAASAIAGTGMEDPPPLPDPAGDAAARGSSPPGAAPIESATETASVSTASARRAAASSVAQHRLGVRLRRGEQLHLVAVTLPPRACAPWPAPSPGAPPRAARRAARPSARSARSSRAAGRSACRCGWRCASASTAPTAVDGVAATGAGLDGAATGAGDGLAAAGRGRCEQRADRRVRAGGGWADEGSRLSG